MSIGEADAKFPGQQSPAIPPSPTRENPGQVYPKSDPNAAPAESVPGTGGEHNPSIRNALGNPYALESVLDDLHGSLSNAISTIAREESSVGASGEVETLLHKFTNWRKEVDSLRSGRRKAVDPREAGSPAKGGMFAE